MNEIHIVMSKLEHLNSDGKLNRTEIQFISLKSIELPTRVIQIK